MRPRAARLRRQVRGIPVYGYRTDPDIPPVSVLRLDNLDQLDVEQPHIHDFPALVYAPREAVVFVLTPGQVVDPGDTPIPGHSITIFFDPDALGRTPWPTWGRHPLLSPFLHGHAGGLLRVELPADDSLWEPTARALEAEIAERRAGYRQALLAHLTLLLIDLARRTADVVEQWRGMGEPLLADVFDVIDKRYREPLSLRDVARAVGVTPGHLTTVVGRRTGRTVGDWITERRMAAARELLTDTDLPIGAIAHRVGMPDPAYFTRVFRRTHDIPPREWRGRSFRTDSATSRSF